MIGLRHIFSAEIDDQKRAYLLESSQDMEHLFGDVACFREKRGYCYKCRRTHKLTADLLNIDLLVVGPSCKDISNTVANVSTHRWGT